MVSTRHSKLQQPETPDEPHGAAESDHDAPEEVGTAKSKAQETARQQHIEEAARATSAAKSRRRGPRQPAADEQLQSAEVGGAADDVDAAGDADAAGAAQERQEAAVQSSGDAVAAGPTAGAAVSQPDVGGEDRLPDEVVAELLRRDREAAAAESAVTHKQRDGCMQPARKRRKAQRQPQLERRIGSVTVKALEPRQRLPPSGVALAFKKEQGSRIKRSHDMLYPPRAVGGSTFCHGPAVNFV